MALKPGLQAALESFREVYQEMQPENAEHHARLGWFRDRMPLAPDYARYLAAETAGDLITVILRMDGRIVGYHISFVHVGLHYATTNFDTQDVLWIAPEARRMGGGSMLLTIAEDEFRRRSGGVMIGSSKIGGPDHAGLDTLYRSLGFEPFDLTYAKWVS